MQKIIAGLLPTICVAVQTQISAMQNEEWVNELTFVDNFDSLVADATKFWQLEEIYDNTEYLELVESEDSLRAFKDKLQAPGDYLTTFPVWDDYPDKYEIGVYDYECQEELNNEWETHDWEEEYEPDFDNCFMEDNGIEYGNLDFYAACDSWSEMWHQVGLLANTTEERAIYDQEKEHQ